MLNNLYLNENINFINKNTNLWMQEKKKDKFVIPKQLELLKQCSMVSSFNNHVTPDI